MRWYYIFTRYFKRINRITFYQTIVCNKLTKFFGNFFRCFHRDYNLYCGAHWAQTTDITSLNPCYIGQSIQLYTYIYNYWLLFAFQPPPQALPAASQFLPLLLNKFDYTFNTNLKCKTSESCVKYFIFRIIINWKHTILTLHPFPGNPDQYVKYRVQSCFLIQ